jgi:hypothetical protein
MLVPAGYAEEDIEITDVLGIVNFRDRNGQTPKSQIYQDISPTFSKITQILHFTRRTVGFTPNFVTI